MSGPAVPPPYPPPAPQGPPLYQPQGEPRGQWDPSFTPMSGYQSAPPRELPLSKAAVASLVLSIIGGVVLSVIFAIVGLSATANGNRRGRGFAWAGLAISLVWIVGIVAAVVVSQSQKADRGLDGTVQDAGTADVLSLQRGDCLQEPTTSSEISNVDVVPCTQSHDAQVFQVLSVSGGDGSYDQARIKAEVEQSCTEAGQTAITTADRYDLLYFYPQSDGWARGDRTAVCMLSSDTPLTASVITAG